ncbi:hypothetical protein [Aestuariivivens sediminis]|uniref:BP74-related protein n=1 Tax=Aestuariivivens sediminis TaxID=2913557 RepID=UPI001F58D19D|nr:hypothetical protein [Aestuariivivens sediminis]
MFQKIILKSVLIIASLFSITACHNDKEDFNDSKIRYFRFQSCPESNHGNWQDSSFVAATSNPVVIQQCLEQLGQPIESRMLFPLGKIENGSGGYNTNSTHEFNWHFVEDSWELVELGIEIYDGCPYSDVELTDYVNNLGSYGGWSNRILEEITML